MLLSHEIKSAPGPRGHALLGSILDARRDRLRFLLGLTRKYGDVVRFRFGPKLFHLVNDPELIRHVLQERPENYKKGIGLSQARHLFGQGLLTSQGQLWMRQRPIIERSMRRAHDGRLVGAISRALVRTQARWRLLAKDASPLNMMSEMSHLTLAILGDALLGSQLWGENEIIERSIIRASNEAVRRITSIVPTPLFVPTPRNRRYLEALRALESVVHRIIEENRSCRQPDSLISALIEDTRINAQQLRDEVMTMLIAGHETTAAALTWTWYLLAQAPEIRRRVKEEGMRIHGENELRASNARRIEYARMVLKESVRLYPPVWLLSRESIHDDVIGDYFIPAKSGIIISPYVVHRNESYWPKPEIFDPSRFGAASAPTRHPYSYLSFGAGPRSCVGAHFGLTEAASIISILLQRFTPEVLPGQQIELETALTLRPKGGILMTIRED